jgi:regulator of RNase E activity RraA
MEASFELGLAGLSTCQISDALISLGIPSGGFIPDIRPISLSQERIAGQAYTVRFVVAANTEAPALKGHFLDHAPKGSVVFIEAPPGRYRS